MILLQTNPNLEKCQREYINATFIDVSVHGRANTCMCLYYSYRDTVVLRSL